LTETELTTFAKGEWMQGIGGSAAAETGHQLFGGFRMRVWTKLFRDVPHLPRTLV